MFRVIARGLLARKFRLFATALAVMLGVAFMAGTMVLTDTIGHTFNDLSSGVYKGTDAEVRAKAAFNGPAMGGGPQRPLISAALVQALRRVPGVAADEGSAYGYARLTGKNGKALGDPAAGAPALGGNWNRVSRLNPWTLVAGHPPQAADQVVIDAKSATDGHLRVGDITTVLALGPPQRYRVVGIVKFGTADSPGGASVALFTTPVAQRLVAAPGKLTSVLLVARPGVSQQQLAANLRDVLPHGLEAVTGATVTREMQDSFQQALAFYTFMLIFAVIALLVGAFMIFNTFSITVAQRTRENGLLRALGASKRQVLGTVLAEAAAVGIIASAIGLAAGVAVAAGLEALLSALGFGMPAGGIVFGARTVIVAGLAGLTVTLAAALSPARKAAKVSPVAAMQEVPAGSTGYGSKQRILVGTALLVLGAAALFTGLFAHVGSRVLVVGAGALLVFFAVSVLGRTVSLPLSRALGAPLPRLRGIPGKLARANAMRNPKRTAASASALMIGAGLVGFITILASSTTASVNSTIDRSFAGDIVIDSGAGLTGGIDPALAPRLAKLPQVATVAGVRGGLAEIFGAPEQVAAVDPQTIGKIFHVGSMQGSTGSLGRTGIAVYRDIATARHLKVGSAVPVVFRDTGPRTLRVALIYGDSMAAPAPRYFLATSAFDANFTLHYDSTVVL
jgi:putative ABC transport system permease protein